MVAQIDSDYFKTRPTKAFNRLIAHALLQGRPLTTRGQWLNYFIVAQLSVAKRLPSLKSVHNPIYILGTGRSGSTILGKILSLHPDIVFLNEAKALWHTAYSEEDLIGTYSRGKANYVLNETHVSPEVEKNLHHLYSYALTITGAKRILDKHGEMIFRVEFIRSIFPDVKFIFLVRNGWDTIVSIANWSAQYGLQVGSEWHDWWGANGRKWKLLVNELIPKDPELAHCLPEIRKFERQEDMAATEWVVTMRQGLKQLEMNSSDIYLLRYEDLIENPTVVLDKVLAFCGLRKDNTLLSYADRTLVKNPPKKPVNLSSCIQKIFLETLERLNNCVVE